MARTTTQTAWISAHLFHRGAMDDLITGTVAPLIGELNSSRALNGFFFLRYWEGGPHLRLRILPTSTAHADRIRESLIERSTRYLTQHPSPPIKNTA
jgi:thiopeptide-type bacteriocin biosynthesis protein